MEDIESLVFHQNRSEILKAKAAYKEEDSYINPHNAISDSFDEQQLNL